jgi:FHA domain-containing protein
MPVCPSGHDSAADDYCDVCGARIAGAAPVPLPPVPPRAFPRAADLTGPVGVPQAGGGEPCPDCGVHRQDDDRFCEDCGYDYVMGAQQPQQPVSAPVSAPSVPVERDITLPSVREAINKAAAAAIQARRSAPVWFAEVKVDRAYFEQITGGETQLNFPGERNPEVIQLGAGQVRIGRRSTARSHFPEIDLSAEPMDPGVSHLHAVLMGGTDGGWQLVDPGSANGTTLNENPDPLTTNMPVPVGDGDRIHVGAWTTITLRKHIS